MMAHATAYREWAIAHPEEFRLVYGDPILGYLPPTGETGQEAAHRLCAVLLGLVAAAWPHMDIRPVGTRERWSDFCPDLVAMARESFPELSPAAVGLCLRFWQAELTVRPYGLRANSAATGRFTRMSGCSVTSCPTGRSATTSTPSRADSAAGPMPERTSTAGESAPSAERMTSRSG